MVNKILLTLCITVSMVYSMEESPRTQYMKQGAALSATMNSEERLAYMISGNQILDALTKLEPEKKVDPKPVVEIPFVEPTPTSAPQTSVHKKKGRKNKRRKNNTTTNTYNLCQGNNEEDNIK